MSNIIPTTDTAATAAAAPRFLFVLGPTGAGKSTIMRRLKADYPHYAFPISCTTRDPRPGELDGVHYHFLSREIFEAKIAAGEFLEYAQVHGDNYYGTLHAPFAAAAAAGVPAIKEVDIKGMAILQTSAIAGQFAGIFLHADEDTLLRRAALRSPMTREEMERRRESMVREYADAKVFCDKIVDTVEGDQDGDYGRFIAAAQELLPGMFI